MSAVNLELKNLFLKSLSEDHAQLDITALATIPPSSKVTQMRAAQLIAKESGIWVGSELMRNLPAYWQEYIESQNSGSNSETSPQDLSLFTAVFKEDGQSVKPKDCIAQLWGSVRAILIVERNFLNIVGYLSGIATATHNLQGILNQSTQGPITKILDTRKVLPGFRDSAKYAVLKAGGCNHRRDLSDQFLIKENHIHYMQNNIADTLKRCQEYRKQTNRMKPIIIEVQNMTELAQVYELQPDRILLDNFSNENLLQALSWRQQVLQQKGQYVPFEASGNMNSQRLQEIKNFGLDFVSVGSITHSVKTLDLSLLFEI